MRLIIDIRAWSFLREFGFRHLNTRINHNTVQRKAVVNHGKRWFFGLFRTGWNLVEKDIQFQFQNLMKLYEFADELDVFSMYAQIELGFSLNGIGIKQDPKCQMTNTETMAKPKYPNE